MVNDTVKALLPGLKKVYAQSLLNQLLIYHPPPWNVYSGSEYEVQTEYQGIIMKYKSAEEAVNLITLVEKSTTTANIEDSLTTEEIEVLLGNLLFIHAVFFDQPWVARSSGKGHYGVYTEETILLVEFAISLWHAENFVDFASRYRTQIKKELEDYRQEVFKK